MFIPKGTVTTTAREREVIAIIGAPGSGKTTSCLSFPNRIWADFDHKLPAGEQSVPFWNPDFIGTLAKPFAANCPANKRDAWKKWLRENYNLFTPEQTFILDSYTNMQAAFNLQEKLENDMVGDEKKSGFTFWGNKQRFSEETSHMLSSMKCRVVVLFHERVERDDKGELTGKLSPVLDGRYKDEILKDFTDVWRQICFPYKRSANGNIVIEQGKKVVEETWFWQLMSDETMNCNMNPTLGAKARSLGIKRVRANYDEIVKIYESNPTGILPALPILPSKG